MSPPVRAEPSLAASDVADLVLHGSIARSVYYYLGTNHSPANGPHYDLARQDFLNAKQQQCVFH